MYCQCTKAEANDQMRVRPIIKSVTLGNYKVDVTQAPDCFNGLIYKDSQLVGCVAAGLSEGIKRLIEKAQVKINQTIR